MAAKHVLGLHTQEERKKAYAMARKIYQHALLAFERHGKTDDLAYATGYVEAILDLFREEAPDPEFMTILVQMRDDLVLKSPI